MYYAGMALHGKYQYLQLLVEANSCREVISGQQSYSFENKYYYYTIPVSISQILSPKAIKMVTMSIGFQSFGEGIDYINIIYQKLLHKNIPEFSL